MFFENKVYDNKLLLSKKSMDFINKQHLLINKYDLEIVKHDICVANIVYLVGSNCKKINYTQLSNLYFSALVHDIGKIFLSKKILNKPDRLTFKEMSYVQQHSTFGANFIEDKLCSNKKINLKEKDKNEIIFNIKHHHELLDGSGYPDNLNYTNLPITVQILTLADVYSALAEKRIYKSSWDNKKIFDYLNQYSSHWFNNNLVNLLENKIYEQKSVNT